MSILTLLFVFFSLYSKIARVQSDEVLASESDHGIITLAPKIATDANIYFVKDLELPIKIHAIVSIPDCACVGAGDVEKIAQLDYLAVKEYLFSFAIYVNYNIPDRVRCGLTTVEIQSRTSLEINYLGTRQQDRTITYTDSRPVPMHTDRETGIQGSVIYNGMRDFRNHSYVQSNRNTIYGTDKNGGIFFVQGTLFARPCKLWPWYLPWILDSYGEDYTLKLVPPFTSTPFLNATEVEMFYQIFSDMREKEIVTDKHMAHLKENNDNHGDRVRIFSFQALFVFHRFVPEFLQLLEPFKDSGLSPYVYIPLIFQMIWDKNSWSRMQDDNTTIYATRDSYLDSCLGKTVSDTMANKNNKLVDSVRDFAEGWCGRLTPVTPLAPLEEIQYIFKTSKRYFLYHLYEAVFIIVCILVGISMLVCMRKRIAVCAIVFFKFAKKLVVRWCVADFKYQKVHVNRDFNQQPISAQQMQAITTETGSDREEEQSMDV